MTTGCTSRMQLQPYSFKEDTTMAENNGLSVSDVAALSGGGFGGFGNGFEGLIYLAVIASMFGGWGGGFGGFGNGAAVATGMATQADMQREFDS